EGKKEPVPTLVSDIQVHPIKREPLAIDFYMISRDTKIETKIPITLIGEAPAEKEDLIIVKVLDEIEIESLPQNIPDEIEVDISNLESTQDRIYVKDLEIPEDIEIKTRENNAVVTVSEKEEEIVEEEPEVTPLTEELEDLGEEEQEEPEIIEEKDETEEEPKEE
ncbi:MAG TPA: 50S ribosomal protein L25, partial [Candidatus Paceibacterota bacterium]|nr:50S ribosomal protein L25 [Candidatus Paceibacterota bacterium]